MEGYSTPEKRSARVVLEANTQHWDKRRFPKVQRIIFDNTLDQKEALKLLMTGEGRVDLVTGLGPLDTLRVAQSPFAKVVKTRGSVGTVFGLFNMRKVGSPWRDARLRHAVNFAINRADLIRYATKGNGVIIPALLPPDAFGYNSTLTPYPFDPAKARQLFYDAGHPTGSPLTLIAPEELGVQATVLGKMLEHVGLKVESQILDAAVYNSMTALSRLAQPAEQQTWDIALTSYYGDGMNFPVFEIYRVFALGGGFDWVMEKPELKRLSEQVLRTVHRDQQQELIRQMERHTSEYAYFLFLYNPIHLYAVNKAVEFVPYQTGLLSLTETSVTDRHWSMRKAARKR